MKKSEAPKNIPTIEGRGPFLPPEPALRRTWEGKNNLFTNIETIA